MILSDYQIKDIILNILTSSTRPIAEYRYKIYVHSYVTYDEYYQIIKFFEKYTNVDIKQFKHIILESNVHPYNRRDYGYLCFELNIEPKSWKDWFIKKS